MAAPINFSKASIQQIIDNLNSSKRTFKVVKKRANVYIYDGSRLAYYSVKRSFVSDNEFTKILSFIGIIRKELDKYINSHPDIAKVKANHNTVSSNMTNFKKIEKVFWEIDINNAYLQVLFYLGYISESTYNKYKNNETYKQAYIYALTWLQSDEIVEQYANGVLVKSDNKYKAEYKTIYDNVRYFINNMVSEAISLIPQEHFIKRAVDAIYIHHDAMTLIRDYFISKGIEVKKNLLFKFDESNYIKENKIIAFK